MKRIIILLLFVLSGFAVFSQENGNGKHWKIDSVAISRNWRTRDKIIMRELQFQPGETVDRNCLETSMNQVWNIGNFALVDYSLDSISPESYLLNITAKDAFTLLPNLSFRGTRNDYNLVLGVVDNNFLGRNIMLNIQGNIGTYSKNYSFGINIPRQLLYKNMTLSFSAMNGTGNNYRYTNDEQISVIAYHVKQFSAGIGNPWQDDYHFVFSPNFGITYFEHKTDTSLIETDVPFPQEYDVRYLAMGLNESIGMINHRRNQKDGYLVSAGYGVGLGIDNESPFYQSFSLSGVYYELINKVVELSASFTTGYTTANLSSMITYLGPGHIKGLLTGKESGQGFYSGKLQAEFTYITRNWFALEHSVYLNFGKADDRYFNIYKKVPPVSIGTGFRIWTPMVPWLGASIHFVWLKGSSNWFYLDI